MPVFVPAQTADHSGGNVRQRHFFSVAGVAHVQDAQAFLVGHEREQFSIVC